MTDYLSSISGSVNKLIELNVDNVNDGFIDPENNGNGGYNGGDDDDDDDDDVDDDLTNSVDGDDVGYNTDLDGDNGHRGSDYISEPSVTGTEFSEPFQNLTLGDLDDSTGLTMKDLGSSRRTVESLGDDSGDDINLRHLMSVWNIDKPQAEVLQIEMQQPDSPFRSPEALMTYKDYYNTNSNREAQLYWMVDRHIIAPDEMEQQLVVSRADHNPSIEGPEHDQGTMVELGKSSGYGYDKNLPRPTPRFFNMLIKEKIYEMENGDEIETLNPALKDTWNLIQMNWDRYSDAEREAFMAIATDFTHAIQEERQKRSQMQEGPHYRTSQEVRDDDDAQTAVTHKSDGSKKSKESSKSKQQPTTPISKYDAPLSVAKKREIRTKVDNQYRNLEKGNYNISDAYRNIMNYSQNPSLSELYRAKMRNINDKYYDHAHVYR